MKPFHKTYINDLERNSVCVSLLSKICLELSKSNEISSIIKLFLVISQIIINVLFLSNLAFLVLKYGDWKRKITKLIRKARRLKQKLKLYLDSFS